MMPVPLSYQAPVPPQAYHRAQQRLGPRLEIDALTLVLTPHLLALCRLAVRLARRRYPSPYRPGRPQVRRYRGLALGWN
jgi:hypothetical protein